MGGARGDGMRWPGTAAAALRESEGLSVDDDGWGRSHPWQVSELPGGRAGAAKNDASGKGLLYGSFGVFLGDGRSDESRGLNRCSPPPLF